MLRAFILPLLACLFLSFSAYSQVLQRPADYSRIDSFARQLKYPGDVYRLTQALTTPLPTR